MVDTVIQTILSVDPIVVLGIVFLVALIENLFPPSPSDVAVVAAGSLVGMGRIGAIELVAAAALGGTVGFMAMYKVGHWFGDRILETGKVRFLPPSAVHTVEGWFRRYGYWIIVANRFLAGTRAVVSFFAGMSELHLGKTIALSFVSALAWNAILVAAGYALGRNFERIGFYLTTYGQVVTAVVVVVVLVLAARYIYRKNTPAP